MRSGHPVDAHDFNSPQKNEFDYIGAPPLQQQRSTQSKEQAMIIVEEHKFSQSQEESSVVEAAPQSLLMSPGSKVPNSQSMVVMSRAGTGQLAVSNSNQHENPHGS